MKKSFSKTLIVAFLSCFMLTTYLIDFKSIFLSVETTAYLMYGTISLLLGLIILNTDTIKTSISMLKVKKSNVTDIPKKMYLFTKAHNSKQLDSCDLNVLCKNDKILRAFFSKFKEKYNKQEIKTFLLTQKNQIELIKNEISELYGFIYVIIAIASVGAYIYDSHMKGILALSMILAVGNLSLYRKIKSNIEYIYSVIDLCQNVSEDILEFRNARYVMYKTNDLLLLDEIEVEVLSIPKNKEEIKKDTHSDIEDRKSSLIKLNSSKSNSNMRENKRIAM